jgi:hypothetical protein
MNSGTAAAKEAANMIDLDSNPTKLIEVVAIGKQVLITRGAGHRRAPGGRPRLASLATRVRLGRSASLTGEAGCERDHQTPKAA